MATPQAMVSQSDGAISQPQRAVFEGTSCTLPVKASQLLRPTPCTRVEWHCWRMRRWRMGTRGCQDLQGTHFA